MTRKIWLIRHAESLANTGAATHTPADIPLTDLGKKQAREFSLTFERPPGLIITSLYIRTQQTAAPTLLRFPLTPHEIWDSVHEFTYLAPGSCMNTTITERRGRVIEYWKRMDPDYRDGEGAETFREFTQRARITLERLQATAADFSAVFTHGQFMQAMRLLHLESMDTLRLMESFTNLPPVENCEVFQLNI